MGNKLSISDEEIEELVLKAAQAGEDCSITRLVEEANKHNALDIYERIHDSVTRKILELGINVNIKADQGFTPLIAAATFGNYSLIKILLENGADTDLRDNFFGNTALIAAAIKNCPDIVSELLMKGADETIKNNEEMSAIEKAEQRNNTDVVRIFSLRHQPESLCQEMMTAARAGNARLMSGLITLGADLEARDEARDTALHIAARKGLDGVVLALLDQGIKVDVRGDSQRTALIVASKFGHLTIVRILMDAGADARLEDEDEKCALEEAVENNNLNIVLELLDRGVKKDPGSFDLQSPSDLKVELTGFRDAAVMGMILDKNMIERNNEISAESLKAATENGSVNVVKDLLERGACLDHRPGVGETPFQIAVRLPQIKRDEFAKYVQKLGCVNMKPRSSEKEIMKKAENNSNQIAKLFLSRPLVNCDPASVSQRLSDIFNWTQKAHFDETILGTEKKVYIKCHSKDKETLMKSMVSQGSFDENDQILSVLGMKIHFQSD